MVIMKLNNFVGLLFISMGLSTFPVMAQEKAELPGGASSLRETYQDWTVQCQVVNNVKQCAISQQQQQQNGQRVLAVEFQPNSEGGVSGIAVMPFGLKLSEGVKLQIDDQAELPAIAFSTCLPAGCILPIQLDAKNVAASQAGQALKLKSASVDGREMTLPVSLKGFSAALDRVSKL